MTAYQTRRNKRSSRRNPMTAGQRAYHERLKIWAQEKMTAEQKREIMRKAMHAAITRDGTVQMRDLTAANLPRDFIDLHSKAVLTEVLEQRKAGVIE
jgi:hypothetical protein